MNKFFIDKNCEENLKDGLPYFAAGIIEEDYRIDERQSFSGKDFAVVFIDPWGVVSREWRAFDDIRIIEVNNYDFEMLKESIRSYENQYKEN